MANKTSQIPGFYRLSLDERRRVTEAMTDCSLAELSGALDTGGLTPEKADKVVENVLGTYALPFGVALNFRVNGLERWVPMVVEEPSVIAAASNAAQRIRLGGGFVASMLDDLMTAQIEVHGITHPELALSRIVAEQARLLELAAAAVPGLVSRGGGPRSLEVRLLGEGFLVVHVYIDCRDAMGANLVNTVAERVGPEIAQLSGGTLGLRILSNLCDRRRVKVTCQIPPEGLLTREVVANANEREKQKAAVVVADAIESASRFASLDPYRAATHNKGILNGVDSVVIATGNDYRAVEAGAHAFAAKSGRYLPLATWHREGSSLIGTLEMPLALGIVGGTLRVHPTANLALKLLDVKSAAELSHVAGAAGLASNFSALRALTTDGIQRGHMALQARSVATLAGAVGTEVEQLASMLSADGKFSANRACELLLELRKRNVSR